MANNNNSKDYLSGLCHYDGPASDLPVGGYSKVPGWAPESVTKRVQVLDAETDEGFVWKKRSELKPGDILIGIELNQNSINAIVNTYGDDFYLVREANGGPLLTLEEWYDQFHTSALPLVALRDIRMELEGTMPGTQVISYQKIP